MYQVSCACKLGFPGSFSSINCSKYTQNDYPTASHGQHKGKVKVLVVPLEEAVDDRLSRCKNGI